MVIASHDEGVVVERKTVGSNRDANRLTTYIYVCRRFELRCFLRLLGMAGKMKTKGYAHLRCQLVMKVL